jgi:hypothetical protein
MFYKTKVALMLVNPYANIENCETFFDKDTIMLVVKKEQYQEKLIFTFLPVGHSIHKLFVSLDQFDRWFFKHENL